MDAVSYVFCTAVTNNLQFSWSTQDLQSKIWQKAAQNAAKVVFCNLHICERLDGNWSYEIKQREKQLTFAELKEVNRRDLRIGEIWISISPVLNHSSSFEEIKKIAEYTIPSVHFAKLTLMVIPQNHHFELLSIYGNSVFAQVEIVDIGLAGFDFLLQRMQTKYLKKLDLFLDILEMPTASKNALMDFALSKNCETLLVEHEQIKFDMDFFEALFEKPINRFYDQQFQLYFSFDFAALKDFKKDLQVSQCDSFQWLRADHVRVTVMDITYEDDRSSHGPFEVKLSFCWRSKLFGKNSE